MGPSRPVFTRVRAVGFGALLLFTVTATARANFVEFESGPVRPLAMSADGTKLFAVNTPDNRLEIFSVGAGALTHTGSVPVGLEPVAVAAHNINAQCTSASTPFACCTGLGTGTCDQAQCTSASTPFACCTGSGTGTCNDVWVVNHLSDSISIVDGGAAQPHVTRTLLVGDEPRDVVFAGPGGNRAFITCAHRGQNTAGCADPKGCPNLADLTTAGIGRADVWVFDATNLGSSLGGSPLSGTPLVLFTDTPRALAVSSDGSTVYAAGFHTGNRTTTVNEGLVCDTDSTHFSNNTVQGSCSTGPGGLPLPHKNSAGNTRPETGLVVQFNGSHWVDRVCVAGSNAGWACQQDSDCPSSTCGRTWDSAVKFNLPDKDVFAINANATPPLLNTALGTSGSWAGVGTILFNMAVNPVSGKVYVTNAQSRNERRFEGPGIFGRSTVQGHLAEYRITVLDGASVLPRHLNKHLDYSLLPAPDCPDPRCKDHSLATPLQMAVTSDGATLYVAAFGSSKIGVFNTATLENDTFTPNSANHIAVSGGGPSGLILDEARHQLYVLTRFDNGIAVIDTLSKTEVDHPSLYNPEPTNIVNGRPFLYDAYFTSSNGEVGIV